MGTESVWPRSERRVRPNEPVRVDRTDLRVFRKSDRDAKSFLQTRAVVRHRATQPSDRMPETNRHPTGATRLSTASRGGSRRLLLRREQPAVIDRRGRHLPGFEREQRGAAAFGKHFHAEIADR